MYLNIASQYVPLSLKQSVSLKWHGWIGVIEVHIKGPQSVCRPFLMLLLLSSPADPAPAFYGIWMCATNVHCQPRYTALKRILTAAQAARCAIIGPTSVTRIRQNLNTVNSQKYKRSLE